MRSFNQQWHLRLRYWRLCSFFRLQIHFCRLSTCLYSRVCMHSLQVQGSAWVPLNVSPGHRMQNVVWVLVKGNISVLVHTRDKHFVSDMPTSSKQIREHANQRSKVNQFTCTCIHVLAQGSQSVCMHTWSPEQYVMHTRPEHVCIPVHSSLYNVHAY